MKGLLAGETTCSDFHFMPTKVGLLANKVFVEGHGRAERSWWVHVWTVHEGRVCQLREYFNTAIMVTNCTGSNPCCSGDSTSSETRSELSVSRLGSGTWSTTANSFAALHAANSEATLWQNSLSMIQDSTIPGIILVLEGLPN